MRPALAVGACLLMVARLAVAGDTIFAIDSLDSLVRFDSTTPSAVSTEPITNLVAGDAIVGIDFRPATGELYGLGNNGATVHLYKINTVTGTATQIGGDVAPPRLPVSPQR